MLYEVITADYGEIIGEDGTIYKVTTAGRGNLHIITGEALPPVGMEIRGVLDWERRHKLMRTHTAMHILCGVVWRDYGASVTRITSYNVCYTKLLRWWSFSAE